MPALIRQVAAVDRGDGVLQVQDAEMAFWSNRFNIEVNDAGTETDAWISRDSWTALRGAPAGG